MKTDTILYCLMALLLLTSCNKEDTKAPVAEVEALKFVSAVDISSYPEIASATPIFYDTSGNQISFLATLKEKGVNTIRVRLWVNPANSHSGFEEVKQFSQTLRDMGFKIWITVHYSDSWADPGQQHTPERWQGLSFNLLKDSVGVYTKKIVTEINPDFIQIGNEINAGFLHPLGHIENNFPNFIELMSTAIAAVRSNSTKTKIIVHFAGIDNADWFFDKIKLLDYDIIGLSYYPIWHGTSVANLKNKMIALSETHDKKILIAETAYPFTLGWNDWTNNIVGLNEHLILPEYPASEEGQKEFVKRIRTATQEIEKGYGFCYWGGELIAWKGTEASDGSQWENQALFDFQNRALPVLDAFK